MSYRHYLASQKTIDYLDGQELKTTTEFFYNSPSHYQVTSQKTTFPDHTTQETKYKYAHEKGIQKLITANMVGIPLETETIKGGKILGRSETKYDHASNLFPSSVLSYNLKELNQTPPNPSPSPTIEVTYDFYDANGNLLQYTTKAGLSTALIWGYNNTQPIAKVEGATYTQASAVASAIVTASDTDAGQTPNNDESSFLALLDTFRKNLPGFQVTTYTYDPLIGVRSITPPSGIREVYIYDTVTNRLKEVREQNASGNLLKEYQYHYKP